MTVFDCTGKGDPGSYPASELGAENDKANDKLVDLVSLLTNKINKNVKEIQVDIIDHYDNTNKKFDNIEEVNGDRVKELTKQVEERKEANKALRSKIADLQKKQKGVMENYVVMEILHTELNFSTWILPNVLGYPLQ